MSAKVKSMKQPPRLQEVRLLEIAWANGCVPLIYVSLGIDSSFDYSISGHYIVYAQPLSRKGPLFRKLDIFASLKDKEPHTTMELDGESIRIYASNPPMCKCRFFDTKEQALAMVRHWDHNWSKNYRNFRQYKKDYANRPGKKFRDYRTFRKTKGKKLTMRLHHLYFQAGTVAPPLLAKTQPVVQQQTQQLVQVWHVPPVPVAVWPTKNHKTLYTQTLGATKIELKGDALLKIKPVLTTASNLDYDGDEMSILSFNYIRDIADKYPLAIVLQTMNDMSLTDKEMQMIGRKLHIDPSILPLNNGAPQHYLDYSGAFNKNHPMENAVAAKASAAVVATATADLKSAGATSTTAAPTQTVATGSKVPTNDPSKSEVEKSDGEKDIANELVDASSSLCRIA